MRIFSIVSMALLSAALCGCMGAKNRGASVKDPYDGVRIDQMVGNHVSGHVLERTIVCLNARRETHILTALTNQSIALVTNVSLSYITNLTFTFSTNRQSSFATNEVAAAPLPPLVETNATGEVVSPAAPPPSPASTNVSLTTAHNASMSRTANQTVLTASAQQQRSRQITTTLSNVAISAADSENISAETNLVVIAVTNVTLTSMTNLTVTLTNLPVHDYFLVVEYTPPPDFTLQTGESLVLLVDGERHSLAQATSPSVVVPRRGFSAALYRATPQLFVDIANAKQARLRLKGVNAVIEKRMSAGSRANFRKFLLEHFTPAAAVAANQPTSG